MQYTKYLLYNFFTIFLSPPVNVAFTTQVFTTYTSTISQTCCFVLEILALKYDYVVCNLTTLWNRYHDHNQEVQSPPMKDQLDC